MKSSYVYAGLGVCALVVVIFFTSRRTSTNVTNNVQVQSELSEPESLAKTIKYNKPRNPVEANVRRMSQSMKQSPGANLPAVNPAASVNIVCTENDKKRDGFLRQVDYNLTVTIPENERLLTLTHEEAASLYHRITEGVQDICRNQIRLGNVGDGGYYVCEERRPPNPCLVYSFGIRNDFTFDDDVSRRYGCEVHSFDPGMNKKSFRHSDKVYFHDTGIAGHDSDGKWRLRTLHSIKEELNHQDRNIDILKIDTEGAEWDSLENMLKTGELGRIPQILLEFHLRGTDKRKEYTRESYIRALGLIREMNRIGYRIFYNLQTWNCEFVSKCSQMKRTNCADVGFILRSPT